MNFTIRNERYLSSDLMLAPVKKRFYAFLIDWVIIIMLYFCVLFIFSLFVIRSAATFLRRRAVKAP